MTIVVTILALSAVLVLAWFGIKFLSKLNHLHPSASKRMQILQTVAVGSRERLVLVRYQQRDILLGVTAGGVSVIDNSEANVDSNGEPRVNQNKNENENENENENTMSRY